ncbi:MAG TPA: flagellar basal body-associated FliL family protein [Rhodanobacteraceae bacterium]|nr:flagellar basal body-associated FliL family protein [Oleiagrimonas sp.]HET9819520.1 flagellar basal body-associated FliL family protein [Rhodanobacteraceae bacterium]
MPTETPSAETPAPRKSRKLLWLVILVVVVVLTGVGGFLFVGHGKRPAKPELSKTAEYYTLDPSIVVNFTDARAIRFLQVGVSLMSHDPAAIKAAQAADPAIRNTLLLLFSSQKYDVLATADGKRKLQQEALAKVQDVVQQSLGRPGIEAVYFTSFVMQ